ALTRSCDRLDEVELLDVGRQRGPLTRGARAEASDAASQMKKSAMRYHRHNARRGSHYPFSFSVVDDGKEVHLILEGELDVATAPLLLDYFHGLSEDICVDLSCLDFVDSSGLSLLISMQKRARTNGMKFTLRFPNEQFLKVVE